ncbi:tRNA (guanine-N1)-methyltransferase [Terriglobus roseus DSM 18391]|uniref:tRNA (guanine-N(1)-)-methyltransferase n=1 Tax=Terriglobus roseus (strain DSM 18391 / NRRL B-41598 / KBS 63) TaxID=926566 RepID=I3ZGJ3_TERRK|nr:tRNA (guanosine(37)-N1)-methyltransferase TrmD [Terriglobus roseus]AFL88361.1 tRNA (guanine-N1)-methyltransferase [Terriglobus roseus DSM 18391]AFL88704.1 tRNA (guanine-N1)-methyltransferase [Terriglobus roseus DSM 18391]
MPSETSITTAAEPKQTLRFDIVTIFPDFFESTLRNGVVARALNSGIAQIGTVDLRSFTHDRHRTVDDRPFGGGEGMVLKPEPLSEAIESLGLSPKPLRDPRRETVILLSAQGSRFTQAVAHELKSMDRVVLVCGRYEGVDERVNQMHCDRELSIGDYVLSGGELGAAIIVDAVTRLLPGVLGNPDSAHYESFGHAHDSDRAENAPPQAVAASAGLLDYPHYTRPAEFRGVAIPDVLAAGDHLAIRRWRRQQALLKTLQNRPDLLAEAPLTKEDRRFLESLRRSAEPNQQ